MTMAQCHRPVRISHLIFIVILAEKKYEGGKWEWSHWTLNELYQAIVFQQTLQSTSCYNIPDEIF